MSCQIAWFFAVVAVLAASVVLFVVPLFLFYRRSLRRGPARSLLALTIDDGPDRQSTPRLLAVLAELELHATFFCPGVRLQRFPELADAIVDAGHEIANHSYSHPRFLALLSSARIEQELNRGQTLVARWSGNRWFRPVAGIISPPLLATAKKLDLVTIGWTARARDGGLFVPSVATALRRLRRGVVPGGIILLHDRPQMDGVALIRALDRLAKQRGLTLTTLTTLLADSPTGPAP